MDFDPEIAAAVESGDMFACDECHDFISEFDNHCPFCHVGVCENCGIPVTLDNVGDRDFVEPGIIFCKPCFAIEINGNNKLTTLEKAALSLLR